LILVVNLQIFFLVGWRYFVGAKKKPIRMSVDNCSRILCRLRSSYDVLRYFIPGDVEINMTELRIINDVFDDGGLLFNRTNDSTYADVRPNKGGVRMS